MPYQCTFDDIRSTNPDDSKFDSCREKHHEIVKMLDKREIKSSTKPENRKSINKVKGKIGPYFVESIVVDGRPTFICYNYTQNKLDLLEKIEYLGITYKPLEPNECGYFPYIFSREEVEGLYAIEICKEELLGQIKEVIDYYLSMNEIDKHLVLGDLVLSYCQEWISTVHFDYFVGETESGKSSVLHLCKWLAYRCLYGEDIPNADIYNFLGTDEEAAGTIAEDEAQELGRYKEKIRTYKNSYSKGSLKPRIIGIDSHQRKQVYYKTFCPKLFAGEKIPEDKGFLERLVIVHMTEGNPSGNIKRLSEEEKKRLNNLRNKILIWKVQNIIKGLQKAPSNLEKRDQELWEDFLSTTYETKYFEKCKETASYYINQRHESIWNSIEARLFKLVLNKLGSRLELSLETFWSHLTNEQDHLPGTVEKETFYPHDFGLKITRNYLSRLFEDKYQAKRKQSYKMDENGRKHQVTTYQFNQPVIDVLRRKYNAQNGEPNLEQRGRSGGGSQLMLSDYHVDDVDHYDKV